MFQTIQGSAHDIAQVADKSVHLICTSPPYLGLRSYDGDQAIEWPTVEYSPMPGLPPIRAQGCEPGCVHEWADGPTKTNAPQRDSNNGMFLDTKGESGLRKANTFRTTQGAYCIHCGGWRGGLGLEPDPFAFVGHLILCLREWHRILRDDGLVFCNLGDSYAGGGGYYPDSPSNQNGSMQAKGNQNGNRNIKGARRGVTGLKPKDLMQIPQRFALAAQADGWYLRSAIVWAKGLSFLPDYAGSCMPESVTDRPTQSYEMVYMLAKSERYFCDMEGVKEENSPNSQTGGKYRNEWKFKQIKEIGATSANQVGVPIPRNGRNLRNVFAISPVGFSAAHFACWPERLVEPLIKMGTSARGCCPACGAPWRRVVEKESIAARPNSGAIRGLLPSNRASLGGMQRGGMSVKSTTTGWEPTCTCDAGEPQPCTVLDPFSGSGTTGKVAVRLGRRYIGVDLSEKYLTEITEARMGAGVQMELTW